MSPRACLCGAVDCTKHGRSRSDRVKTSVNYGAAYQSNRAVLMRRWNADATTRCWIPECRGLARLADPWEPDHIIPVAEGGTEHIANLRPAHRSCNRARGAQLAAKRRKDKADARAAERIRQTYLTLVR